MDSAVTENAWDGKMRAQISQEKRKLIQFNATELLAASSPSPLSVHSYKITKQISVRYRFQTL